MNENKNPLRQNHFTNLKIDLYTWFFSAILKISDAQY